MNDANANAYREEAAELLSELEVSLLELEERPDDAELVGRVFRALHTIKGSGAMFGFDAIAAFAHEIETVFDQVRDGRIPATPALVGATLAGRDHIQALLPLAESEAARLAPQGNLVLDQLRRAAPLPQTPPQLPAETSPVANPAEQPAETRTCRIHFEPAPDILRWGVNPLLILRDLAKLGDLTLVAHLDRIPMLDRFDPELCYTYWDAVLTTSADEDAIRDIFIFVEDRARISISPIEVPECGETPRLGDLLVSRGDAAADDVERCLDSRPRTGELLVEAGVVSQDKVDAALLEQQHLATLRDKRRDEAREKRPTETASIRVPAAKLDNLVNIVGELVTVQARLSSYALASGDAEAAFISEEVERLTELLRENSMSIRMLPVGETFARFRRMVRDLSATLGKRAELITSGNDTELDKTVIEQLSDPLLHIIRNAVDHGIEPPERRLAAGKPAVGRIQLSAAHAGAFVLICVADDGAGLNRDAIRARAIERGLVRPETPLTDQQINALILAPGFSTAAKVTEVSGRGVGMDVVQRNLDALRGTLSVSSSSGAGTTITLRIPLTLAIIDGLLVETGDSRYVVPLSNVSACMELTSAEREDDRQTLLSVRGKLIPYISLRERFHIAGERPPIEQVIIADTHSGQFGFVVDRVIGDHHTVIKKLGRLYREIDEVSGATILGDGSVALILDVEKLVSAACAEADHELAPTFAELELT